MDGEIWSRRYIVGSLANWLMFLGIVAFLSFSPVAATLAPGVVALVVLFAAASVAAQFIAAYRQVAAQDEFVRALTLKQGVFAAGATITVAVLWGLAEQFLGAPDAPAWVVHPLFWGLYGMLSPFIRTSRA